MGVTWNGPKGGQSKAKRLRAMLRRAKTSSESKYSLSGNVKTGSHAPKPITLRRSVATDSKD